MGERTGFLEARARSRRRMRPVEERLQRLAEVQADFTRRAGAHAGERAAWIAAFRSATTAVRSATSFPTGTTSCSATSGKTRSRGCTRPTISPSSRAWSARRRARQACVLGINDDAGHDQADRVGDRPPRLERGLDQADAGPSGAPGARWRSSAPARRGSRRRSSSVARATRSRSSRRAIASADCCATGSRSSSSRSASIDRAPRADARGGRRVPDRRARRRRSCAPPSCAAASTPSCSACGAEQPRDLAIAGPRTSPASTSRWTS